MQRQTGRTMLHKIWDQHVGKFIGAERGIGRLIIESEARGEASGMMVAVVVLMLVGVILSAMIWRLQAYLLRWRRPNVVE